ncbi:Acetyltransferase (GNAT) family protein [Agromyces sp. CF514]|uniref:GNAT family N-acetyltransferase n=1 Tax=Agromyces sp. CF514 TaxID=1881031 RepID=UPI0008EE266D|nr:GNAT family N-acetyltransferase [Agromyces sp. CF514]SFR69413.1 Acetyltransferase (GNAT) family protein [Agromyces sp. CF514]
MSDTIVRFIAADDPLAKPLLDDLEREYDERYGDLFGEVASVELNRYPVQEFALPHGAFLVLVEFVDGVETPIAGGAFRRYDDHTAELKRIWTRADRRGRGLAGEVVAALEAEARRQGYTDIFLTTGPRQPEAVALYLRTGYEPQFDPKLPPAEVGIHAFRKRLAGVGVGVGVESGIARTPEGVIA